MNSDLGSDHKKIFSGIVDSLTDEKVTMLVSEWAEKRRVMPPGLTALPGPWSNDVAPYMVEIMDCLSETSDIQEVAIIKGAQICATTAVIENHIGYVIDVAPGPMMYITGDKSMAEQSIELKVDRMLESTGLSDKIYSQSENKHNKKTGNTNTKKEFPGGFLLAFGPRSGTKLRGMSIKYLMLDEIDAYPQQTGDEGDPISLAFRRTDSYELTRKVIYISTPLVKQTSRILPRFEMGDQRYYHVPCKKCKHYQPLKWGQLKWATDKEGFLKYDSVYYECEKCGAKWQNSDKVHFLGGGKWVPTAQPKTPFLRSYQISSLYSPVGMRSWESIVQEWLDVKDNPAMLKVFVNTVLGETWEERGEATHFESIYARRETYTAGEINEKALFLTLGADVQKDRIECEIVAWGRNKESWSVNYFVFEGDTSDNNSVAWQELELLLTRTYIHPILGDISIMVACIDAGYNTTAVYGFCEQFAHGVYPIQGDPQAKRDKIIRGREVNGFAITRYDLQSDMLKDEVYGYLRKKEPLDNGEYPAGYSHFPKDYDEKYFKMLTAESKFKERKKNGTVIYRYKQIRQRNEALDCRCYALAAVYLYAYFVMDELQVEEKLDWKQFWWYIKKTTYMGGKN